MRRGSINGSKRYFLCVLLGGSILACGCQRQPYEVAPVSGRILLDNKPTANIGVNFQPVVTGGSEGSHVGPGSFAVTDNQGRFSLELVDPAQPGAVVGKHTVCFSLKDPHADAKSDLLSPVDTKLPLKYRDGSITFDVPPGGTDQANFNLELP